MQLNPLGRRDRVVQRLLDDRMDEPRRQARIQELGIDQGVHRLRGGFVVHARDLGDVRQGGIVTEDRQCLRHGPSRGRASPQSRGHKPGHRRRTHGRDGVDAYVLSVSLLEGRNELTREQRVPARRSSALDADVISRLLAEAGTHHFGDGRRTQRWWANRRQRLTLDELVQGLWRRSCLASPDREDCAGRDLLDPRLEISEEPKRMLVGPMRIVDEEGKRPLVGQPRAQPVQAVKTCEQAIVGGRSIGNLLEQRPRQSRGTCEDPFALALCQRLDARRQQLNHHAEYELALHHGAARAKNCHPLCLGQLRGLVQQRTLADPGRSLDHHDPARAGCGGAQRIADLLQLRLALEQMGAPVQIRHPAPWGRRTSHGRLLGSTPVGAGKGGLDRPHRRGQQRRDLPV